MVCLNAAPSTPTRFSTGTRTSVKNTSQKCRLVVMSLIGRTSMPGVSIGTMISLMPACGGPSVLVRQMQVAVVGDLAEAGPDLLAVDHPVVAVAHRRGLQAARSLPAFGSLMPMHQVVSPDRILGRNSACWSGRP